MCTSLAWKNGTFYFGRNLDLEVPFGQRVVITPRRHRLIFRREAPMAQHYAMIGMATVIEGQPLYAEAANEKGLCIAGLNFPDNACYAEKETPGKAHIAPFELPWWLLGQCATVQEARALLEHTQVMDIPFSESVPTSPLHWHVADGRESMVVECMQDGMHLHDDPFGVLTNNPPFDFHRQNVSQYMGLTALYPENRFAEEIPMKPLGRGLGGFGLPGDASPASRFVRAAFLKLNSACEATEASSTAHFFHLLDSVAMTRGSVMAPRGQWEYTQYSCCINADEGIYYYKTYENNQLTAIHLHNANLDGEGLTEFPIATHQQITYAN